jgi:hypothetical protein
MVHNGKNVELVVTSGKLYAYDKSKKYSVSLPKGTQIYMRQKFDWLKYLKKYNELRMRHEKEWTISQIELISVALACEKYPWGFKLKENGYKIKYNEKDEEYHINMIVEVM